ncbi:MAG: DUF2339 domain-containing protein [Phycisphaerales bacterium]
MEGILFLLAVVAILSGPIALIVALTALRRVEEMRRRWNDAVMRTAEQSPEPPAISSAPVFVPEKATPDSDVEGTPASRYVAQSAGDGFVDGCSQATMETVPQETSSLEQRIGTRWVLVAGVVTVIFAVGFFLKYAYESQWIGPWGRVAIAGFGGLIALAIGEVTRRRGYDFVARGVTALGFAILYATVFAAHRWYHLTGSVPAYALAIGITAAAMIYAVVLDEVTAALLSLAGGYLTPIVLSTGENLPHLLFLYILILGAGAMLCAYRRKWSGVNILAFVGTYLLYAAWFERFYRPVMDLRWPPPQLAVALSWLAVFFLVFLTLPVLHTLLRRVRSQVQDTLLLVANAAVVFYYLWTMLMEGRQDGLALCSVAMGAAHLGLMALVSVRCRADRDLCSVLLIAGLACISLAVPFHFEKQAIAVVWAVEAVALAAIGLRYRSTLVQAAAGAVLALAIGRLAVGLPLHAGPFQPVWNSAFGAWCFVAAVVIACHVMYRLDTRLDAGVRQTATEVLYAVGLLVLMTAVSMELWHYGDLFRKGRAAQFLSGQMPLVQAASLLLFAARPWRPKGPLCPAIAMTIAIVGSLFLVMEYFRFCEVWRSLYVNTGFLRALVMVMAVFAAAWLLRRAEDEPRWIKTSVSYFTILGLTGVLVLWLVMTEEIWFHFRSRKATGQWQFLAQMYISLLWAAYASVLMIVGFWRRVRPLRYISLGIFLLLLGKIFLVDTRTVETVYRIAGFLVTGLALVAVSYLYQYLKKKGFFEAAP